MVCLPSSDRKQLTLPPSLARSLPSSTSSPPSSFHPGTLFCLCPAFPGAAGSFLALFYPQPPLHTNGLKCEIGCLRHRCADVQQNLLLLHEGMEENAEVVMSFNHSALSTGSIHLIRGVPITAVPAFACRRHCGAEDAPNAFRTKTATIS